MSPTGPAVPRRPGPWPLLGLAALGVLGAFGRKPTPSLAVAAAPDGPRREGSKRDGRSMPSDQEGSGAGRHGDSAPGEAKKGGTDIASGVRAYGIGLALAALLTAVSFWLSATHLVYGPAIYVALIVFAVAQIGIHLVFFLHLTTAPDNINNTMALAFGVLILGLLVGGTLWIMAHMNANMMPMADHPMPHGPMTMAP